MNEQAPQQQGATNGRKRWLLLVLLLLVALVVALLLLGPSLHQEQAQPTLAPSITATPTPQLAIDPNAGELITPTPAPVEPGVAIPGWGSMTMPSGVTEVATSMQNPAANEGWYYLTFELRLKDTDEVIFTTGLIPPGQYCNKVTLTRALEPGEYAAIMHVQPYRISDLSPTNNADMETVLIVE